MVKTLAAVRCGEWASAAAPAAVRWGCAALAKLLVLPDARTRNQAAGGVQELILLLVAHREAPDMVAFACAAVHACVVEERGQIMGKYALHKVARAEVHVVVLQCLKEHYRSGELCRYATALLGELVKDPDLRRTLGALGLVEGVLLALGHFSDPAVVVAACGVLRGVCLAGDKAQFDVVERGALPLLKRALQHQVRPECPRRHLDALHECTESCERGLRGRPTSRAAIAVVHAVMGICAENNDVGPAARRDLELVELVADADLQHVYGKNLGQAARVEFQEWCVAYEVTEAGLKAKQRRKALLLLLQDAEGDADLDDTVDLDRSDPIAE